MYVLVWWVAVTALCSTCIVLAVERVVLWCNWAVVTIGVVRVASTAVSRVPSFWTPAQLNRVFRPFGLQMVPMALLTLTIVFRLSLGSSSVRLI